MKKRNNTYMITTRNIKRRLSIWALVVTGILTIPLAGRAPWTFGDYVFAAVVLFGFAGIYELSTRNMSSKRHRIIIGFVILAALVAIQAWAAAGPD